MAHLIKTQDTIKEGEVFNKFLHNRLRKNKNVLTCITGPTGSSKSYQDLRRAELWYEYHFHERFPPSNICFSISEVMKRITSKELRKGEVIILEEAGANLGSLDFQSKVSKLFTYVLQSFRSMNVFIFFNVPYLSMLNKQARLLIHVHFVTHGIDQEKQIAKSKAYFRQVNQDSGKIYGKFLRLKNKGRTKTIKRFNYTLPSEYLSNAYEVKKTKFLSELTLDFSKELDIIERDKIRQMARKDLTDRQQEVYDLAIQGLKQKEIGDKLGISAQAVGEHLKLIKDKGYKLVYTKNPIEKKVIQVYNPISIPS